MQAINLNLAIQLQNIAKEKNVKLVDNYMWYVGDDNVQPSLQDHREDCYDNNIPAYTADEVIEMLPDYIEYLHKKYFFRVAKSKETIVPSDAYLAIYSAIDWDDGIDYWLQNKSSTGESLANACCQLLIWIIKEGFVK